MALTTLFFWFNADKEKIFGKELAEYFLDETRGGSRSVGVKHEKRQRFILAELNRRIIAFKHLNKSNVYKKAQLGNSFKWRLLEDGVDSAYVDELTDWIAHHL